MLSLISTSRINRVSQSIQSADTLETAKAMALKLNWFEQIGDFFSVTFGNNSFHRQLEAEKPLIENIVDVSYLLHSNFKNSLSHINTQKKSIVTDVQNIVCQHIAALKKTESCAQSLYYCLGYNAHDKMVVLKLREGDNQKEINLLDLGDGTIDQSILDALPKYWVGAPNDYVATDCMEEIQKNGLFSGEYSQFFTDAKRQTINGIKSETMLANIKEACSERPLFVPHHVKTSEDDNKKLHAYAAVLDGVNPLFNDKQKNIFFMLCSQDNLPGRGGVWNRTDVIGINGGDVYATVTTNKKDEMLLSVRCSIQLRDFEPGDGNHVGGADLGSLDWEVKYVIDTYGVVKCVSCEAPITILTTADSLTTAQRFSFEYLKEINEALTSTFRDHALKKIQHTPSYQESVRQKKIATIQQHGPLPMGFPEFLHP